ncbi:MAG: GNAT family N-acetyltransferase [Limisphaerales bacterium]
MNTLSFQTDSIFHRFNGTVEDKGEYFVIRTRSNPTFYWGNYLLFKKPPDRECFSHWMSLSAEEFGMEPGHTTFCWDTAEPGDATAFVENGFQTDTFEVLTLSQLAEGEVGNDQVQIRKLAYDSEWKAVTELQIETGTPAVSTEAYRAFKEPQMLGYRKMQEAGRGAWWGAFRGSELVGDLGLFFDTDCTVGRFQSVETAPAHRGQGICRSLLRTVAADALKQASNLVIVAEAGSHAAEIYRKFGFQNREYAYGVCRTTPVPAG